MADPGGMAVDECRNMIRRSFRTPMVRFLTEQLEKTGCGIGSKGWIVVRSNHVQMQDEVTQVMIHELIMLAASFEPVISGDCHYKRELLRGHMKLRGHEQVQLREAEGVEINGWEPVLFEGSIKGCNGSIKGYSTLVFIGTFLMISVMPHCRPCSKG